MEYYNETIIIAIVVIFVILNVIYYHFCDNQTDTRPKSRTYFDGENELTVVYNYFPNGDIENKRYFLNGILHRKDGPAIVYYENGNIKKEEYWFDHKKHRLDGPAKITYNNDGYAQREEFWINGKELVKTQFPDIDFENWPLSIEEQALLKMSL